MVLATFPSGLIQKTHPNIAVSVKTQNAARRILNDASDYVSKLGGEGILDELEAEKLENVSTSYTKPSLYIPDTLVVTMISLVNLTAK